MAEIEVLIEAEGWSEIADVEARVITAANAAFAHKDLAFAAKPLEHAPSNAILSLAILLADDATLRRLNSQFRGIDKPTNVLSFPSGDPADGALGDIAIAYETALREAMEEDKTLGDHLTHLVVHGTLHLLGYDHETQADAEVMEAHERQILAKLNIADPYAGELVQDDEAAQ